MSMLMDEALEDLRGRVSGVVITADHPEYDTTRRLWNAAIDGRPSVIVRCTSTADVQAAVRAAVEQELEISVRGGSHSFPGYSMGDEGLVVDLSGMRGVEVDASARRARVQGGALLGEVDAATQAHGLAAPFGMVSHTGVGGLTLGGGMGWLSRMAGLSIDNLTSAEVVLADGEVVTTSADAHPDLFWAIRGGGGNFGVVTEFEFALREVEPMVSFGLFFWSLERGTEALRLMRDVITDLPLTLNAVPVAGLTVPPLPFVPAEYHFASGYALELAGFGDPEAHQAAVNRIRSDCPPSFEFVTDLPYVGLQSLIDEPNAWGSHGYDKGVYLTEMNDEVIDVLTRYTESKESPLSIVILYRLDGAYSDVANDATAFSGPRTPCYFANLIGLCPDPAMLDGARQWVRSLHAELEPYAVDDSCYVNVLPMTDVADVKAAYGSKFERLQQIKKTYDPGNVFHRNANIPPAGS